MTETDESIISRQPVPPAFAELGQALAEWETERQQLRNQIASLRTGLGDIGRTHAMTRQMWASTQGKAEATHAQAWSQLDSEREEHRTQLAQLRAQLEDQQAQYLADSKQWNDERQALVTQLEGLQAHSTQWTQHAEAQSLELRTQLEDLQAQHLAASKTWDDERQTWATRLEELQAQSTQSMRHAEAQCTELRTQLDDQKAQHLAARTRWDDERTAWVAKLEGQQAQSAQSTQHAEAQSTELRAQLEDLQAQHLATHTNWEDERRAWNTELEGLKAQLAQSAQSAQRAAAQSDELHTQLEDQSAQHQQACEAWAHERQAQAAELHDLKAQAVQAAEKNEAARREQLRQFAAERAESEASHLRKLADERSQAETARTQLAHVHAQQSDALRTELAKQALQNEAHQAAATELRDRLADESAAQQADRLQAVEDRARVQAQQTRLEHQHAMQQREWEKEVSRLRDALQARQQDREHDRQRHASELAALRAGLASSQGTAALAMERLQQQAVAREEAWDRRLQQQEQQWQQRHQDLRTQLTARHDEAVSVWTGQLAAAETLAQTSRHEGQQAWQQLATEREEWQRRSAAAAALSQQEYDALRAQHASALETLQQEADAELNGWRQELTEARRQLQQEHLALFRQSDNATRALQSLRAQQQQERALMQAAVQRARQGMAVLAQGVGGQLESLRLAPRLRLKSQAQALQALRTLQQQVHDTAAALDDARPVLGLPEPRQTPLTLPRLMGLEDDAFVRQAYHLVLHRDPDSDGHEHYLRRLRQGEHRLRVLADLRLSGEGQTQQPLLEGLDDTLRALRKSRMPVLGRHARQRLQAALRQPDDALQVATHPPDSASPHLARIEASLDNLERGSSWLAETVPIAVTLGRAPREYGLDPWACAQELARAEGAAFINLAFALLYRRSPSAAERQSENQRLARGASRVHVLDLLLDQATGGRHTGGSAPAQPRQTLLTPGAPPHLPTHERPEVTVILVVHGHLTQTLRCLRAMARHAAETPFEVVAVDDASPDDTAQVLAQVQGLRLVHQAERQGFAASCNAAAKTARGHWLHFLHGATEVRPGWLDELWRTFDLFPGTGMAGSKLVLPDGRVQAAGQVIWQDGSIAAVGHEADPSLPRHNHAREVDSCSASSLMVPRHLFDAVGGFDRNIAAGSEAAGLALALQDRGYRVMYQPGSVVMHHDDPTPPHASTDRASHLQERWARTLALHAPAGSTIEAALHRRTTGRLLAIEHRMPRPDRDAGSVSVFNMLVAARELGLHVSLLAEADIADGLIADQRYVDMLQRSGIEVLQSPLVTSMADYLSRHGTSFDAVLLFRPVVMERHAAIVERLCPQAKRLYYPHDLHFLRKARQAAQSGDTALAAEAVRSKPLELALHTRAHLTLVASAAEQEVLAAEGHGDHTQWLPLLLDTTRSERPAAERKGLLFIGNFRHAPNVDALVQLVQDIMPRVRALRPDIELWVVGEDPPVEITQRNDVGVHFVGPCDDLSPLLASALVSVAPLRFGAGAKGKVARALAAGLPMVASTQALEGMGLVPDEHVLVADNADAFAQALFRLHDDDTSLWQHLSDAGHRFAVSHWGPKAATQTMQALLHGLGIQTRKRLFGSCFFNENLVSRRKAGPTSPVAMTLQTPSR